MIREVPVDPKYSKKTIALPKWQYKLLRPYNGFSGIERIRCWQLARWAINVGILRSPHQCSISGAVGDGRVIQYHSENYYDPFGAKMIHSSLHKTLHQRFKNPAKWEMVKNRYRDSSSDKWFLDIPDQEPDYAKELQKHGVNSDYMVLKFIEELPRGAPRPSGLLHTLQDFTEDGLLIRRSNYRKRN